MKIKFSAGDTVWVATCLEIALPTLLSKLSNIRQLNALLGPKCLALFSGCVSVDSIISILRNWMCFSQLFWAVCAEVSGLLRSPTSLRVNKLLCYVLRTIKAALIFPLRKWVTEFNNFVFACHLLHVLLLTSSLRKLWKDLFKMANQKTHTFFPHLWYWCIPVS